jgi:hypothetical protein
MDNKFGIIANQKGRLFRKTVAMAQPARDEMEVKRSGLVTPSSKEIDDRQQDDGTKQRDQHGRQGDHIIDRPDLEDGAEEEASQKCAQDSHNDIDQQARAVVHDFSRHPADYCGNDQVYENVHFYLLVNV